MRLRWSSGLKRSTITKDDITARVCVLSLAIKRYLATYEFVQFNGFIVAEFFLAQR